MWSAIFFRMMPIFSMRTLSPGAKAGGGAIIGVGLPDGTGPGWRFGPGRRGRHRSR
jgi:hypothetical protein